MVISHSISEWGEVLQIRIALDSFLIIFWNIFDLKFSIWMKSSYLDLETEFLAIVLSIIGSFINTKPTFKVMQINVNCLNLEILLVIDIDILKLMQIVINNFLS